MGATVTGSVSEPAHRAPPAEAKAAEPQKRAHEVAAKEKPAAAAAHFAAAKVVATAQKEPANTGPMGLQLATAPTPDDLRLAWLRIMSSNKEALHELEPRFVQIKIASGHTYRLIAGPVGSAQEGTRMCAELKANKVRCTVTAYKGDPL
jgi:hypothetical protein